MNEEIERLKRTGEALIAQGPSKETLDYINSKSKDEYWWW